MRHAGVWLFILSVWSLPDVRGDVDYVRDVKPILQRHCYSCHGALQQKSGLRLDHVSFLRIGGDRGPALAVKSADSLLVQALDGSGDIEQMPLEAKPLAEAEVATLKAWVDGGARRQRSRCQTIRGIIGRLRNPCGRTCRKWPTQPGRRTPSIAFWRPSTAGTVCSQPRQPTKTCCSDACTWTSSGSLRRRMNCGLFWPTIRPTPCETVVDRLLASPHYGERWGRHWMDVWRYSDWDGYAKEVRESQPHIWRWRDWIVESLNADKPYDEMIREMLAADEMAPDDPLAQRATGFLARNWYKFNRNVWLDNTVEHTSKAFLGITLNCARCHDHMYDPIQQTEYYAFRAFFEPHQVRTDRVPGESNTERDGLVRAYDANAEQPTFLFVRGNEAQPDKDKPLAPAVPDVLGGEPLVVESIRLPAEAYYPGLRAFVQQESLAEAQGAVAKRQQSIGKASTALAAAQESG